MGGKSLGEFDIGDGVMIEAERAFAFCAAKMQVIIAMLMILAIAILAEGILDTLLFASDAMDQAILLKGFEVSVERHSVELPLRAFSIWAWERA